MLILRQVHADRLSSSPTTTSIKTWSPLWEVSRSPSTQRTLSRCVDKSVQTSRGLPNSGTTHRVFGPFKGPAPTRSISANSSSSSSLAEVSVILLLRLPPWLTDLCLSAGEVQVNLRERGEDDLLRFRVPASPANVSLCACSTLFRRVTTKNGRIRATLSDAPPPR